MSDIGWRDKAACLGEDPELFFPINAANADLAKRICTRDCKVRTACATTALRTHTAHGVAGGYFLPDQKTSLRRYVEKLESGPPDDCELIVGICESCGSEMHNRIKLAICGSCRAFDRDSAVSTVPVREHIDSLRDAGWTLKAIYETAEVSQPTASRIARGEITTVSQRIANAILAVEGEPPVLKSVNA